MRFAIGWGSAVPWWHDNWSTVAPASARVGATVWCALGLERRSMMSDRVPAFGNYEGAIVCFSLVKEIICRKIDSIDVCGGGMSFQKTVGSPTQYMPQGYHIQWRRCLGAVY
jgi:hypothetical protein